MDRAWVIPAREGGPASCDSVQSRRNSSDTTLTLPTIEWS
jgi:hypothetical protein